MGRCALAGGAFHIGSTTSMHAETTAARQALAATLNLLSTGKIEITPQGFVSDQPVQF